MQVQAAFAAIDLDDSGKIDLDELVVPKCIVVTFCPGLFARGSSVTRPARK